MHLHSLLSLVPLLAEQVAGQPTDTSKKVGTGEWAASYQKAKVMVDKMTLKEKISLTNGVGADNGCSGNIAAIDSVKFPGMCLSDAGNGLRATDKVSGFPSGIHVGASWNKDLAEKRGAAMGKEYKKKGVNVLLGPVVGPAWTIVKGGRNWEGSSADPYLSGALSAETVKGVQSSNVITSTKHFIGNEQELDRVPDGDMEAISFNVDDKSMHELFLWPFQDAVRAGSANIMCSYQRINQTYGCANDKAQNGLLKGELGFQGFVVSDWGALYGGIEYATAGMDMGMPSAGWEDALVSAVKNGSFPESRIDDMAMRIIASWYQVGQDKGFPKPGIGMPANVSAPHDVIEGRDPNDKSTIAQGAIEGHVLVKNDKDTLPLKNVKKLSIFGYSANTAPKWTPETDTGGSWSLGKAPVQGLDQYNTPIGDKGTLYGGGGSGAVTPEEYTSPQDALVAKAAKEGFTLHQDLGSNTSKPVVPASDACIVFGNAWSSEGPDRPALQDDYTDNLIKSVANQCAKTIVVLHNAGIRLVDGFVDHPNVTAIMFAHLPGQDNGNAIVSLLWGEANPSGKIPYTVAKKASDYGDLLNPVVNNNNNPQADYTAGIYTDYKYFEKNHIQPRYEFGFGLSYSRYDYSKIAIQGPSGNYKSEWPTGEIAMGGQEDLWEKIATVSFTLVNGRGMDGAEVSQLYVRIPGLRAKQLRGFSKQMLKKGESVQVSFDLTRRDLSVWSTEAQKWQLQRGQYEIYIGRSSTKLPLKTYLTI